MNLNSDNMSPENIPVTMWKHYVETVYPDGFECPEHEETIHSCFLSVMNATCTTIISLFKMGADIQAVKQIAHASKVELLRITHDIPDNVKIQTIKAESVEDAMAQITQLLKSKGVDINAPKLPKSEPPPSGVSLN